MVLSMGMNAAINDVCVTVGATGREIDALVAQFGCEPDLRNLSSRKRWSEELIQAHHEYRNKVEALLQELWN